MPYEISESGCSEGKPFAVRVKGGGRVMGCHKTRESAKRQLAALYANDAHTKTAIKRENGMDFPPRDYAYVPDPNRPATWRLRLTETPGKVTELQLRKAAAALSPAGFRGNRLELPAQTLTSVKRRLLAEFRRLKVDEGKIPSSVKEKEQEDFFVWKDVSTGLMRWFAIYSNNFRDDDRPSQIISEKSQQTFVDLVDGGYVDYPELWLWHTKGTAWGKADWVAYASGFAMASGLVYPGMEYVAHNLAKRGGNRVSHGMYKDLLVFDPHDDSTILFHVTFEISPLPDWAAANALTGFVTFDEGDFAMTKQKGLPPEKKEYIAAAMGEDFVEVLESKLEKAQSLATAAGIESKEASDEGIDAEIEEFDQGDLEVGGDEEDEEETPQPVAKKQTAAKAAPKKAMPKEEEASPKNPPAKKKEADPEPEVVYATREEVAEALNAVLSPLVQTLDTLTSHVETLTKEITALKQEDAEKIAATKEVTPRASLLDMIRGNVIGKDAARVDGRTTLAKEGPVETEAPEVQGISMIPLINQLQAKSFELSSGAN